MTFNAYVLVSKDDNLIMVGNADSKRIAMVQEQLKTLPTIQMSKKRTNQVMEKRQRWDFTKSANAYCRLYGVPMYKMKEVMDAKPCTITIEF